MVNTGALVQKWLGVEREVADEQQVLRICEQNRASCQSQPALRFLAIIDDARTLEGRARLGEINRAINLSIRPKSDLALYGVEDVWSSPLATFANGAGDCEDYAIAKFIALQNVGVSADDLRIVILRDDVREEDHAVVAARLDGNWLMLDNLHMTMVEDQQVRNPHPLWGTRRRRPITNTHRSKPSDEGLAIGPVPVADQIAGSLFPAACFCELIRDPFCGRMRCDAKP
jgi:predicted transglutaminase-like cysteine proteinase